MCLPLSNPSLPSGNKDGLDEEPETFPKKPKDGSIGAWFRLPGLHHTKYHYAKRVGAAMIGSTIRGSPAMQQ